MQIFLCNIHSMPKLRHGDFLENCMQSHHAPLGNPFYREPRQTACKKFRRYLNQERIKHENGQPSKAWQRILDLAAIASGNRRIYLQCCCVPKECHTATVRNAIRFVTEKGE